MIGYKNPKPSIRGLGVNLYAELLRFPIRLRNGIRLILHI